MRTYEDVLTELYTVLKPFVTDTSVSLGEDSVLVTELGLDSLKIMDLVLALEEHFDISIPLNILPVVRTVKALALQVQELVE
jgi:acyl carrier protein